MPTIYCIGKNYAAHVAEMGDGADATAEPVVFLKPEAALLAPPGPIRWPRGAGEIHYEAEVVLRMGTQRGVDAVALGLDLTDRSRQAAAKAAGLPWAAAKGFRGSAPVGPFVPVSQAPSLDQLRFTLAIDGVVRQRGDTRLLLHPVPVLIAYLDAWFGLEPGDLIFTGTPQGVGPLHPGEAVVLDLEGVAAARAAFEVA